MNVTPTLALHWRFPESVIAISHGLDAVETLTPPGIRHLAGSSLAEMLGAMIALTDGDGDEIGVMTEIELFGDEQADFETILTVTLPGRGSLFVQERKHYSFAGTEQAIAEAKASGVPWTGRIETIQTTGPAAGGRGVIIGGTGEFAGARGYQQQRGAVIWLDGKSQRMEMSELFWLE